MTTVEETTKKRNSFSLLTWKDAASTAKTDTAEPELANSRFIPESKRGWKYDVPYTQAAPAISAAVRGAPSSLADSSQAPSSTKSRVQRPRTAASQLEHIGDQGLTETRATGSSRQAVSQPVSSKARIVSLNESALDMTSSDSLSSEEVPESSSPREVGLQYESSGLTGQDAVGTAQEDTQRHPDDLVYPESYPWKPSRIDPTARYIHPAHRNPTAKQAFYDTHFGSSSNYRGLLPASGSLLSLHPAKTNAKRGPNNQAAAPNISATGTERDAASTGIVSTMRKPFATASKLLTKARRKSMGTSPLRAQIAQNSDDAPEAPSTAHQTHPPRPHPVPLYAEGGDELAAQRSGFSYGMSMEDAAQVEAVVSRHTSQEDLNSAVQQDLLQSPSHEASSSRWREAMHSVWGFLPSFDFLASSAAPAEGPGYTRTLPSGNILEPEAIPSVKKDFGNPDYFKNLSGNVVILGGYRGSVLRDAETNMMMWIPIKVGVGLRRPTLELGLSTEAEEHSEDLVYSSEMCTHIGKLVDMGKRLEERLAGRRHANVYAWGYDWRLSLARSSRKLIAFLEELYEASTEEATGPKRGAKVVAHSMGGLVALHALATCTNPRIFEGLVCASTPFCGTPNILGPFRFGDAALFNDTICSPRATFSFRSSFYLLPTDGRCFEIPVDEPDHDGEDLTEQQKKERFKDVDFLDPEVWDDLGLSPCLEAGRRRQMIAMARRTPLRQDASSLSAVDGSGPAKQTSRTASANADANIDTVSPQGGENGNPNGLTMGLMEGLSDGNNPAVGQADVSPAAEEQEALQPENRQGAKRNDAPHSDDPSQAEFDSLDYSTQSWLYLDRTLAEVRQFWTDIEQGFDPAKAKDGSYPPVMLLVSGRTPAVRGALVGVDQASSHAKSTETSPTEWKDDVRAGDYSRMTYGAGDGVITRRSATILPGRWSTLLAQRNETETLPQELYGKGAPFPTKPKPPGKARLKMDRYRMHLDGPGIVESSHRHVTLLSDVDGIGKCLEAVRRANLVRGRVARDPSVSNHS